MLKRQCVHSFACQLHLLYLYNLWYFKSLIHKTQQSLGRVCSFTRKQPHSLLTCCPHSTICRQTHHYAQSTRMLVLGLRGSVWTKQGSLSLVIYKHNRAYSPSEGKVALEIKELPLCSHHASSCPLCSCTRWGSASSAALSGGMGVSNPLHSLLPHYWLRARPA